MTVETYINDEPAGQDTLGRAQHVTALAHMTRTCTTPMVVGIYGGWGVGKTSLLKQINAALNNKENNENDQILTVEFESCHHQEDNLVVALLQTMLIKLNKDGDGTLETYIKTAMRAFMPEVAIRAKLNALLAESSAKVTFAQVLEENFQVRGSRICLYDEIRKLVKALSKDGKYRIVCFIDDLDRCAADVAVEMLDALNIYLNIKGCVFVLGVDRKRITNLILEKRREVDYLGKIVQIHWSIPPIQQTYAYSFVASLVESSGRRPETQECIPIIASILGDNPRAMKRFANQLIVSRAVADSLSDLFSENYDERITCALLLLRERHYAIFRRISMPTAPLAIIEYLMRKEALYVEKDTGNHGIEAPLLEFIRKLHLRRREDELRNYIILASGGTPKTYPPEVREVLVQRESVRKWKEHNKEFHQIVDIGDFVYGP